MDGWMDGWMTLTFKQHVSSSTLLYCIFGYFSAILSQHSRNSPSAILLREERIGRVHTNST